jgi:hypothetical protein
MTKRQNTAGEKAKTVPEESKPQKPRSAEEAKVWEILEQARQKVKPIVKKEKEAEVLTSDLLNLRMKAH